MSSKTSLPPSVRAIVDKVEAADEPTAAAARSILEETEITPADLEPWTDFGHPDSHSYGRKRLYDGGFFELMVLSWVDGDISAVHDHGHAPWGAVRLYGEAEHAVFAVEDGVLVTEERRELACGSVVAMPHGLIHQLGNVGQEPFLTLHLHGRAAAAGARLYELDEGEIQLTRGGVFFNLPDEDISGREEAPPADFPTRLRHQVELLKRLMTIGASVARGGFQSRRERRLAEELFAAATWERFAEEWSEVSSSGARARRYCSVLHRELRAAAALQYQLVDAGLVEPSFDAVRLSELLAFSDLERFAEGYLELVSDTYSLDLSSLAAA